MLIYTVGPRTLDPFCIITDYMKRLVGYTVCTYIYCKFLFFFFYTTIRLMTRVKKLIYVDHGTYGDSEHVAHVCRKKGLF